MYCMYAMCDAFCKDLSPHMIFNWDATQFVLGNDGPNTIVTILCDELKNIPASVESKETLGFAVKLYHFHSAAGILAPPVFILSDDSMNSEEYIATRMKGLSKTFSPGSYGWLVFTKTRYCNKAFYQWFLTNVICPFVDLIRKEDALQVIIYCMINLNTM